jgi:hypothetical protein
MYVSNHEEILLEICEVAGVNHWCAMHLFLVLLFGGSVSSWRIYNYVSSDTRIPPFVRDLEKEIKLLQARILFNPMNTKCCSAAKNKRRHNN